jgi:hypothetical protein
MLPCYLVDELTEYLLAPKILDTAGVKYESRLWTTFTLNVASDIAVKVQHAVMCSLFPNLFYRG